MEVSQAGEVTRGSDEVFFDNSSKRIIFSVYINGIELYILFFLIGHMS